MTAIGLLVAVPAVLAYNWLQSRNRRIAELLSGFSTDVLANITSRGAVKPAVGDGFGRRPPARRLPRPTTAAEGLSRQAQPSAKGGSTACGPPAPPARSEIGR